MNQRTTTEADDAQPETETLDHPLEIGTVFTTAGGQVVKVVNDRKQVGPSWSYTTVTYNGTQRRVNSQSAGDLNRIVSEHSWEIDAVPGEVSEE